MGIDLSWCDTTQGKAYEKLCTSKICEREN